ncbi:MAG: HD domain-containing protein, partial [Cyanobacteria bacterium]|nr:HD domain-containing protein [Cyanobacteriota bacterium]
VFGHSRDGGFVGRTQSGVHEFVVDVHTLKVLDAVRTHPDLAKLSPKDQTNLLWAALLHDTGKREGRVDPGHEWASANITWGVLTTLGYPPERIQRIATLVSRHSELSYRPGFSQAQALLSNPLAAQDLGVFYRHPAAVDQLKILNEADIRSIGENSKFFTDEARRELGRTTHLIKAQTAGLAGMSLPLLTTETPRGFALVIPGSDYRVLIHSSDHITGDFLSHTSTFQTTDYSLSASLVTSGHLRTFNPSQPLVAIIAGAPEHISQYGNRNLSTGNRVNWQSHVQLAMKPGDPMLEIVDRVNDRLGSRAREADSLSRSGRITSMRGLFERIAQFDTHNEVVRALGPNSPEARSLDVVVEVMTTDASGKPIKNHNEVKLNNGTVAGLGVIRNGRAVVLENMSEIDMRGASGAETIPSWLRTTVSNGKEVVIPETTWRRARALGLPILFLD